MSQEVFLTMNYKGAISSKCLVKMPRHTDLVSRSAASSILTENGHLKLLHCLMHHPYTHDTQQSGISPALPVSSLFEQLTSFTAPLTPGHNDARRSKSKSGQNVAQPNCAHESPRMRPPFAHTQITPSEATFARGPADAASSFLGTERLLRRALHAPCTVGPFVLLGCLLWLKLLLALILLLWGW